MKHVKKCIHNEKLIKKYVQNELFIDWVSLFIHPFLLQNQRQTLIVLG